MQKKFEHLKRIGGALCLDFANTVDWRTTEHPTDWLHDYAELIAWCRHAEVLEAPQARRLLKRAAADPSGAQSAFARAIELREAIYRLFATSTEGSLGRDLALLNGVLTDAMAHLRLTSAEVGFVWSWYDVEDCLSWPSGLIARSAADLLTSEKRDRVRECAGPGCAWLFLDMSRNCSRRWCDMADCGNRAKARRNYARRRAANVSE